MANTANYHEFTVEAFADPNSVRDVVRGKVKLQLHPCPALPCPALQLNQSTPP